MATKYSCTPRYTTQSYKLQNGNSLKQKILVSVNLLGHEMEKRSKPFCFTDYKDGFWKHTQNKTNQN